eukprot:6181840-Pleurochrysis_carterae.AAC.6
MSFCPLYSLYVSARGDLLLSLCCRLCRSLFAIVAVLLIFFERRRGPDHATCDAGGEKGSQRVVCGHGFGLFD